MLADAVSPAWAFDVDDHRPHYVSATTDATVRGARSKATAAYDQMVTRLTNAWRAPGRDAAPEPDDPVERMRGHLFGRLDEDAKRREQAYRDYVTRRGNSWRTDPGRATAIERQAEMWRGGR